MFLESHRARVGAGILLPIFGVPVAALDLIFSENFEGDTLGQGPASADVIQTDNANFPGFLGTLAEVSDVQAAPTIGSQSLLLQDDLFASANGPQVFWNLTNDGSPLDTSRTLKMSYWHFIADETAVGTPRDATPSVPFQNVVLTGSDANQNRPEGNGNYLANVWNWQDGSSTPTGTSEYYGDVDAGVFTQTLANVTIGQWHRIDNYIPLIDLIQPDSGLDGGSPLFTGSKDVDDLNGNGDTDEFLGYIDLTGRSFDANPDNDRDPDVSVFYSRVLDAGLTAVQGQTPYMFRRTSNHGVAGEPGATDPDLRIRALQLFGGGNDFKTSFYDDITLGYVDTGDITTVIEGIASSSTSAEFDYDGSGTVDDFDATYYIQTVLLTAFGDTNYDFQVDLTDLQVLADNFNTSTSGWENGDLNGDGQVNQADLDLVGENWHHTLIIPDPGVQPDPDGPADFVDAVALFPVFGGGGVVVGDYDSSGQVEQGDLDIVLQNWGTGTFTGDPAALVGGGPFDGTVDQNELDGVLQNWGSTSSPSLNAASVPEPSMFAVFGALGLSLARRRKRL